jgi:hypothetical protein
MVRGIDQPSVGQANLKDTAVPKAKITWLARLIGNRTTTGSQTGPDIVYIRNANTLARWARRNSPAAHRNTDFAATGHLPNSAERGEL